LIDGAKSFSEIWNEAHRERGEFLRSIITRLLAATRRPVPKFETPMPLKPVPQG